jgi:glycosyltransferase involved in cell wall biosynthesis
MHLIGLGLKRRHPALPWLADMRDPWATFDIHASFMNPGSQSKNRRYQDQVLQAADRTVLTSPGARAEFPGAPPDTLMILNNGFDSDDLESLPPPPAPDPEVFRLLHSGLLNPVRGVPALWRALAQGVRTDPAFARALRVELVGNVAPGIARQLQEDPDLKACVRLDPWLAHSDLLRRQQSASVFLAIVNQSQNAHSQIPGKVYEALGLGKPVLAVCPPDSALAGLIQETRGGVAVDAADEVGLARAVDNLWRDHHQGRVFKNDPVAVEAYTREALTRKLVTVLDFLTKK